MNAAINWEEITQEAVDNLRNLIQIDTTNPPGNELPAVLHIRDVLLKAGFPDDSIKILESAPGRGNLVARIRGDGSAKPLLLSGHVDVVPVERQYWTHDPFSGDVADGCVWGRGALDMKGLLVMYLQTFLLAHRQGLPLKRDLILAAIADEEAGFQHGSKFLVDHHRELIQAEYALNESGGMTLHMAGAKVYVLQVAEKGVCWLRMTASGRPGHGSMPHSDNAIFHLSEALQKLRQKGHLPIHLTSTVRQMLDGLAHQVPFPTNLVFRLLGNPALAGTALGLVPEETRGAFLSMLSNSVSPTVLKAGSKSNVIPSEAEAQIDCRLLPGYKPEDAIREILEITGDKVKLEPLYTSDGAEFSTDTPLYRLMEKATHKMDPEGVVVPMMIPGATDAFEYKRAGIIVYGYSPGILPADFPMIKLVHGHDERMPISAYRSGLPALWQVVSEFCQSA
ncbi:MAG TPA: M20/M25/M40 family metallo-hydrolase [Anaerolineales bacterium]|nr:M20/M25/M40 family metallo-hydrolase [Anaerolineales bacterium]